MAALKLILFISLSLLSGAQALGAGACEDAFWFDLPATTVWTSSDRIEQMVTWEEVANTARWHKPLEAADLEVSVADPNSAVIRATGNPGSILKFIQSAMGVKVPRHPWNRDQKVPGFSSPAVEVWKARYSASRSMFVYTPDGALYSVKMPTDTPHQGAQSTQPTKSDLRNSVIISNRRSQMIEDIQSKIGKDPLFDILIDVVTVADKATGNGYVVRDLRPLQDGFYYLPAFSIPYVGHQIAKQAGVPFESLFGEFWGASLGRSKAKLLLDYGLQMKTPNAQNMLIQLDANMRPTGKMFFRDISDSVLVEPVAKALGLHEYVENDRASNYTVESQKLNPNWENSRWQMDEGGISMNVLNEWGRQHDAAYLGTIVQVLSTTPTGQKLFQDIQLGPQRRSIISFFKQMIPSMRTDPIVEIQKRLFSELGQQAIREYRAQQNP